MFTSVNLKIAMTQDENFLSDLSGFPPLRMSADQRTVEVLAPPPGVHEDLLSLYFENKRRSGGGPLASVDRRGDCVVLVFQEASGKWCWWVIHQNLFSMPLICLWTSNIHMT